MHINLEAADQHAVQAYDNDSIQINSIVYKNSLIVSREEIITELVINTIQNLNQEHVSLLLKCKPELIIIGHRHSGKFPPLEIMSQLSKQRIGMECMSLGAACRTYNVLLSELRSVVSLFIL